ncbi:hypothetical protein BDF20DRAFT_516389 [Mycotypha africana]|uniref:uncharacterized protein n=1 Tax=Mycotypha africana TaxID=64632 RepID=UPI0023011EE7|nr:uncharacterized protein BDF20DRAFT_516389 [Mycotypha africana]KAI8979553.1 hypothetical protein BDF20DRAFT_516389 [Mycotypha africana]
MGSRLGMNQQQSSPSTTRKLITALSSIENKIDSFRPQQQITNANKSTMNQEQQDIFQTIQTNVTKADMNGQTTKRFFIPQDIKDKFYAIHHLDKPQENILAAKKSNRGRKRILTPDSAQQQQQQQINLDKLTNRRHKKPRQQHVSPTLYQTCTHLWPKQQEQDGSSNDLSYDNIKLLSQILKVRLSHAKYKLMLNQQLELPEEDKPILPLKEQRFFPHRLFGKQNESSTAVRIGNGNNLFHRYYANKQQQQQQKRHSIDNTETITSNALLEVLTSPYSDTISTLGLLQKTPQGNNTNKKITTACHNYPPTAKAGSSKKVTTPKKRSAAADILPVKQPDGSMVFICEPCHKKYKNRNGLAYHLERCKYSKHPIATSTNAINTHNNADNTVGAATDKSMTKDDEPPPGIVEQSAISPTTPGDLVAEAATFSVNSEEEGPSYTVTSGTSITTPNINEEIDENMNLIQWDKCQNWGNSEFIELQNVPTEHEDDSSVEKNLLHCLLQQTDENSQQSPNSQILSSTLSHNNDSFLTAIASTPQTDTDPFNHLQDLLFTTPLRDDNNTSAKPPLATSTSMNDNSMNNNEDEELFSLRSYNYSQHSEASPHLFLNETNDSTLNTIPSENLNTASSQLHIWEDFNVNSLDQNWSMLDENEPFSTYDTTNFFFLP